MLRNRLAVVLVVTVSTLAAVWLVSFVGTGHASGTPGESQYEQPPPAQTFTQPFRAPLHFVVENPCTGELVVADGTVYGVSHVTLDGSGGRHFQLEASVQLKGESATGARYVTRVFGGHESFNSNGATEMTFTSTTLFIRQGETEPADDFVAHVTMHATFANDGEPTVTFTHVTAECR
jgi:hypothetical protein